MERRDFAGTAAIGLARSPRPAAAACAEIGNRILVVAPQPFYQDRGTPIALRHVLEALVELGYEVDLICFPLGRAIDLAGVHHQPVSNPLGFKSIPIGFSLKKLFLDGILLARACGQLRRRTYRCVHAVEEAAYLMWLPCRLNRVPLVYDMQSSIPDQVRALRVWRTRPVQRLLRWLEGWLVRRVDCVVASAGLGQRVQALGRAAAHREWHFPARSRLAHAKPDACEPAGERELMRRQLGLSASAQVVVYGGNFEPYQGVPLLLAALPLVVRAAPHTLLVLVGAADQRQIEATYAALAPSLREHLRIIARQPRDQVERFLLTADVLVSPRVSGDNAPLKIFDYLGAARPIVATDVPAHRAVLQDEEALLVEPTPEALAQGILRLLQDDQLARRMAGASAARRERVGWPAFIADLDQIYGSLVGRSQ
jgi:glycosyltransferase involved in cell wall biosynthesis